MIEHSGTVDGTGLNVAIVASRYNDFITGKLVAGAVEAARGAGVAEDNIHVFWCPGALEIPAALGRVVYHGVKTRYFDAVVAIGCVIRGDTDHYTFVSQEAIRGVSQIALEARVAVGNAILTVENAQQALQRSGDKSMNKGYEATQAALEMASLFKKIK